MVDVVEQDHRWIVLKVVDSLSNWSQHRCVQQETLGHCLEVNALVKLLDDWLQRRITLANDSGLYGSFCTLLRLEYVRC